MSDHTDERASDAEYARELALAAGAELLALRELHRGESEQSLRSAGDAAAQSLIARLLAQARPDDAVLSEEAADDPARLDASRVWIIDPLDGTREYAEGRSDWAVHVALWANGELTAGAVSLPARGQIFVTSEVDRVPVRPPGAPLRLAVSRSRPPAFVTALAAELDAEVVPMGSAGVKAMSVLTGETDAYVHAGGQYEWDSAAPVAVARAAGLLTSRVDGTALAYNRPDPLLPDLLIARPEDAPLLLEAVRKVS